MEEGQGLPGQHLGHPVLVGEDGEARNSKNWDSKIKRNQQGEKRRAEPPPLEAEVFSEEGADGAGFQARRAQDS